MSETPLVPTPEVEPEPRGPRIPPPILTGMLHGTLIVLGLVVGTIGAFGQHWYFGNDLPVAAVVCLIVLFAVVNGMGRLAQSRVAAITTALGWVVVTTVLLTEPPGRDLVFVDDLAGRVYLFGGFAVMVLAVLLVPSNAAAAGSWLLRSHLPGSPR
ncbi:DUF6113 family protein [Sinosporangium siamense]|nr:DUF6113 family protein [Sinosporangium siamense]